MKFFKRGILLTTLICLIFTLFYSNVSANSASFSDVPQGFWAYDAIMKMVNQNVLSGYPDGTFRPDSPVTRAEFAKMMVNALGLPVTTPQGTTFKDVGLSEWSINYVEAAKNYLTGYKTADGFYFKPYENASREDMACALVLAKGYGNSEADLSKLQRIFSDHQEISPALQKYVLISFEKSLIKGYSNGTFKPKGTLTRGEAASLLYNASLSKKEEKVPMLNEGSTKLSGVVTFTAIGDNNERRLWIDVEGMPKRSYACSSQIPDSAFNAAREGAKVEFAIDKDNNILSLNII
ncbi:MAG: S-layer homology domain-containing protein, partial [Clostridia bacterium]|nr:S-layer homology domain-containing protein [Clostridia bacterium]